VGFKWLLKGIGVSPSKITNVPSKYICIEPFQFRLCHT